MPVLVFFASHWFASLFVQTFFLHRYASHKMFTTNKVTERIFYFFAYIAQGSSFLVPRAYAILHRMHHTYSDTELDPHSPNFFKDVFSMMRHTGKIYQRLLENKLQVSAKFLGNYPVWNLIDRIGSSWWSRIAWGLAYITFYVFFATEWWMYLLLPIHFLMGPVHGAVVNWCGHKYGYQSFDNKDDSRNTLPFDFFMLGELFQNNHHKHPNSPNFAQKWWEFDPVYPVMRFFHFIRLIKMRKSG